MVLSVLRDLYSCLLESKVVLEWFSSLKVITQPAFTCSKSIVETPEQFEICSLVRMKRSEGR